MYTYYILSTFVKDDFYSCQCINHVIRYKFANFCYYSQAIIGSEGVGCYLTICQLYHGEQLSESDIWNITRK